MGWKSDCLSRHGRRLTVLALLAGLLTVVSAAATKPPRSETRAGTKALGLQEVRRLPGASARLQDIQEHQQELGERWIQVHELLGGQHVSRKGQRLLAERGLGAARRPRDPDKAAWEGVDTLSVLLVRIAFDGNRRPDLTTVPEGGGFMLGDPPTDQVLPIDPEPHDKLFFESHVFGLSEYYNFQSGGRLHIKATVLPPEDEGAYLVDDIADYGPGETGGFWTLEGLERLVRDMIKTADAGVEADDRLDFTLSDFDDDSPFTYIIFAHSGSDWQSDVNNDSPNDVPTFFVTLGEAESLIGGGALSECSVIPETTTQDDYEGSIAAALYHEFGHALGLVDIYDATTGLPSVGVWDLMDSGTNLTAVVGVDTTGNGEADEVHFVTGGLPPSLGGWDKWFLGWAEIGRLEGAEREYRLPPVGVPQSRYHRDPDLADFRSGDPQLLQAGSSSREFFLLENRWVPAATDPVGPYVYVTPVFDSRTGVWLYMGGCLRLNDEGDCAEGAFENSGMYDYFLPQAYYEDPGGGLLVWHVNMDRMEEMLPEGLDRLEYNTINEYADGLKLVEADGIRDIGYIDGFALGWYGSYRDPFTPYNPEGFLELEVDGRPQSLAYDRSWTGVHLWDIRDDADGKGTVLAFQGAVEPTVGHYPFTLPTAVDQDGASIPRALDETSLTVVRATDSPVVFFCDRPDADGRAILYALDVMGEPRYGAAAEVDTLAARLAGPPVGLDQLGTEPALILGLVDGQIVAYTPQAGQAGVQERWRTDLGDDLALAPLAVKVADGGTRLVSAVSPAEIYLLDEAGQVVAGPVALQDPAPAAFIADPRVWQSVDGARVALFGPSGWYLISIANDTIRQEDFEPYPSGREMAAIKPALSPDASGSAATLVALSDADFVGAWRLVTTDAWPTDWRGPRTAEFVDEIAVADLDANGRHDFVALTREGVHAWQLDGTDVAGYPAKLASLFPLPDTTRVSGPLVVADIDGDGRNEVVFGTDGGHLIGLDAAGRLLDRTPFRWGDRSAAAFLVGPGPGDDGVRTLYLASQGGYTGPPFERRLTHGSVGAYGLGSAGDGSSEWLGPLGGSVRAGAVGALRDLGAAAPGTAGRGTVVFYPSPVTGDQASVRFYAAGERPARLAVYNLQGEEVHSAEIPVIAGQDNVYTFDFAVASGFYVARFEWEGPAGWTRTVNTLAVAR